MAKYRYNIQTPTEETWSKPSFRKEETALKAAKIKGLQMAKTTRKSNPYRHKITIKIEKDTKSAGNKRSQIIVHEQTMSVQKFLKS